MAPINNNNNILLESTVGQQLFRATSTQSEYFLQNYQQNSHLPAHLSGPAALLIFMNAFNMAYNFKLGQVAPMSPEYHNLLDRMYQGIPLKLTMKDIVDSRAIRSDLSMQDVAKIAGNTKLLTERVWYARTKLDGVKKSQLDKLINAKWNYKILTKDDLKNEVLSNLEAHWRASCSIAYFDSCSLYSLQNSCGSRYSLIAAYHQQSHSMLLLDVKYGPVWVKIDSLLKAIQTVDPNTRFPRGLLELHSIA